MEAERESLSRDVKKSETVRDQRECELRVLRDQRVPELGAYLEFSGKKLEEAQSSLDRNHEHINDLRAEETRAKAQHESMSKILELVKAKEKDSQD